MIQVLRHTAIRLWLLIVWGIPAGLWLLPRAVSWLPELSAGMAMALFLAAGGLLQGLVLDLTGRRRILGLIGEGALWEQAGIRSRAEERYVRAVRVFDSILISPWSGRTLSRELTRVMAGFYLAGPVRYPGFRPAAAQYLLFQPDDETLALHWVDRCLGGIKNEAVDSLEGAVLTALAEKHHNHPIICLKLAVLFLNQERTDFPARRVYRSVLKRLETNPADEFPPEYREKLNRLIEAEGSLTDAGFREGDGRGPRPEEEKAGATLGDQVFGAHIRVTGDSSALETGKAGRGKGVGLTQRAITLGRATGISLAGGLRASAGWGKQAGASLARLAAIDGARKYAKYTLISVMAVWLGLFLWTSLAHMFKTTGPEPVLHPVGSPASGPFTIQVAAYLKQDHADRYIQKLAEKGVAGHVKKTLGGGKTWYLVRVSYFKSKQDAAAFGRKLKVEGKIDDFFVSNT